MIVYDETTETLTFTIRPTKELMDIVRGPFPMDSKEELNRVIQEELAKDLNKFWESSK